MPNVKIIADSVCDLSKELIEQYDISLLPLYVNLGDKSFKDAGELSSEDIFEYVAKTKVLPTTTAASIGDYAEVFQRYRAEGCEVVCIDISSEFSCTVQNAKIAAEEVGGVYVVDSRNLSTGEGHVVLRAAILAQQGTNAPDIVRELEDMIPKVRASFILDNLDYMKKGGRCSSVAVLGANLLKIKPTILVEDGKMRVGHKFRGPLNKVLEEYVDMQLAGRSDIRDDIIFLTHTGNTPEQLELVRKTIEKNMHFKQIIETRAGATVTSHCGPFTLGVLYVLK